MLKKACIALYILTIIVMAAITIVEKYQGSDYVSTYCYGAWWFSLLWALLAAAAILYIIQRRMRRWWLITLHASFVIILLGALLTHLTARRGMVHLRVGEKTNSYLVMKNGETHQRILPFVLILNDFHIDYHPGTQAAADYASQLSIIDGDKRCDFTVSMNNIYSYNDIRFYQTSYDPDGRGSVLSLNSDPYGGLCPTLLLTHLHAHRPAGHLPSVATHLLGLPLQLCLFRTQQTPSFPGGTAKRNTHPSKRSS